MGPHGHGQYTTASPVKHMETTEQSWDLIVVGGGITGAGVFLEAVRRGLRTLLLEQRDFAWGTSSRSSKLVHGGLRYLKQGRLGLMRESVRQREYLLREAPGLISPIDFMVPVFRGRPPGRLAMKTALTLYDLAAGRRQHRYHKRREALTLAPGLRHDALQGAFVFTDAQTDDARLVLRLINEGVAEGGRAMSYVTVVEINRDGAGGVRGVTATDTETGGTTTHAAPAVINATGVWAEALHPVPSRRFYIRPLRGSHLVFPAHVLPLELAVSFGHPEDGRSVFIIPWEGVLLVGTTDVDHAMDARAEPRISLDEARYLLEAIRFIFPGRDIRLSDAVASFAGVRPVLSNGRGAPSDESREHRVWAEDGLVTITGGKLTTFRKLAHDALRAAGIESTGKRPIVSPFLDTGQGAFSPPVARLLSRYGPAAQQYIETFPEDLLSPVPGTATLWGELALTAEMEPIRHLDDLLLRRVRLGLMLRGGGNQQMDRIRAVCQPRLGWSDARWEKEQKRYARMWRIAYAPPGDRPG